MRFTNLSTALFALLGSTIALPASEVPSDTSDAIAFINSKNQEALHDLEKEQASSASKRSQCSLWNAGVRRDWTHLSKSERKDYISAVQCLQKLPAKSDPSWAPGARSRYDDFVAIHIKMTLSIHGTGNFLTWHRYFTWAYEQALRNECGYKGYQPYWNWFYKADDPWHNPLFDGSDTSMSGDGAFKEHNGTLAALGNLFIPSGKGGGCVTSGPFKDMELRLGPVSPAMRGLSPNPSPQGSLGYNPRCLSRDLSSFTFTRFFTYQNLLNITIGDASHDIAHFQNELQGRFGDGFLGLHTSGHTGVGGEATDLFSSPNEPTFFLHHSMVDRVYWIWQTLHRNQADRIAGTITINNTPPSRDAQLSDILDLGVNADRRTIGQMLDTLGGNGSPLCYIYL